MSAHLESGSRRGHFAWSLLGLGLLILAALLGWDLYIDYGSIAVETRAQLTKRAEIVAQPLAHALQTTANGLDAIREDLAGLLAQPDGRERLNRRLRWMVAAMTGVRCLLVVDTAGNVIASNRDQLIGVDFRQGERDRTLRQGRDPAMLYVSAPFVAPWGASVMALGKLRLDDRGQFDGYVLAVLDPDYFRVLLTSVLDAPDMRAELIHGDGQTVVSVPAPTGETFSKPNAPPDPDVRRYLESDQRNRVLTETSVATGAPRLLALRAIWPQSSRADKPLVVRLSRDRSAVFAPWRRESRVRGGLLLVIALLAILSLVVHERRQRAHARLAAVHEAERTQAEMAQRSSEARYRALFEHMLDGYAYCRMRYGEDGTPEDFVYLAVNPAFYQLTGLSTVEGRWITDVIPGLRETNPELLQIYGRVARGGVPERFEIYLDTLGIWLSINVYSPEADHFVATFDNITDAKQAEIALRNSEERLRLALDGARMGTWHWDLSTDTAIWSETCCALFGVPAGTPSSWDRFISAIHPEHRAAAEQAARRALEGHSDYTDEYLIVWPDGSRHWMRAMGRFYYRDDGTPARMEGVVQEITDRKAAETALRRYQQIVETASEMLVFVDPELRYALVNPAYAAFHHSTPEALQGQRIEDTESPEIYARIRPHLEASLAGEDRRFTIRGIDPSGQERWIEAEQRPFLDRGTVAGIVVSLHDLTDVRTAQIALEAERTCLEERVAARTADLQRSEAKLRTLFDLLPIGLSITDPGGRLIECNRAAEHLLGLTREEHLQRAYDSPTWRLLRPDGSPMPPEEYASVRALRENRLVSDVEMGVERPEGVTWISVSAMPAQHPDYGVVIAFVDVTERKTAEVALRASEARARAIIDSSPVPTSISEESGPIRYLNAAFVQAFGYTLADIPTMTDWRRLAFPDPDERERIVRLRQERLAQVAREGESSAPMEIGVHVKDGSVHTVMVRFTPLQGGERLNTLYDITDLKRAQAQAERAAQAKSDFLAHMSHEIRTPMNGILGLAEIALHRTLSPQTRADLTQIQQSATALLGILNDILDYSRIEAGGLTLECRRFDLDPLLATLRGFFVPIAAGKGLDLRIEADSTVPRVLLGDDLRLQQVLSNLIGNALKFTDRGGVQARVICEEPVGSRARLIWTVTDTGIGMDAPTLARLFQPFTQGDSSIARRFGGTGLGLSISQHLVALMGGTLTVASTPGAGTTFTLTVQFGVAAASADVAASSPATAPGLAGARILVAEDQPLNQRVIGDLLRLLGAEVVFANHGGEALERLVEGTFDAVLMDIQMPEMDGLTATRRIRENPAWATLPVIALTAGVTAPEQARIRAAGMTDLLPKPVTLDAVQITLGRWLDRPAILTPPPGGVPSGAATAPDGVLMIPGFDLRGLQQILGEACDIISVLHQFADSVRDDAQTIAQWLVEGDTAAAAARVHRLKGTTGSVGATALYAAVCALEDQLQAGADPTAALARLRQAHGATLDQIDTLPAPLELVAVPTLGTLPDAARLLVTEIHTRLVNGLLPPRRLLAELETALPAADQALIQTLRYHLDRVDYRAARQWLDPWVAGAPTPPED